MTQKAKVLAYLRRHGGAPSPSQIANALGIPAPSVRRIIQELRKAGQVAPVPTGLPSGYIPIGVPSSAPKAKPLPRGQLPLIKSKASTEIESLLRDAEGQLGLYTIRVSVVENRDSTVDGELRITNIPHSRPIRDIMIDLGNAVRPSSMSPSIWFSIGVRYTASTRDASLAAESADSYSRGLYQAQTNYRRLIQSKIPLVTLTGLELDKRLKAKRRRKAEQVFLRLHWNPSDIQPKRR